MNYTDKQIYIGYDINNDFSQLSFYKMGMKGPQSISTITGEDAFLIPTVMCLKHSGQWAYGNDALAASERGEGTLVKDILKHSLNHDVIEIDGEMIYYFDCLVIFLKRTINLVNLSANATDEKKKIVFTTNDLSPDLINILEQAASLVLKENDKIFYQSHKDSIFNYVLFQKRELWLNDILLFDYGINNFNVYRLRTNRNVQPIAVYIDEKQIPEMVSCPIEKKDEEFYKLALGFLSVNTVSCVFLTGIAYDEKWLDKSLKLICKNRRAFIGQNLFAEGACYKAINTDEKRMDFVYLSDTKLKVNIGIKATVDNREQYVPIILAGNDWYETKNYVDVIIKTGNSVEIFVDSISGELSFSKSFELLSMPNRPPKATRIRITIEPQSVNSANIMIEDMGFGEIFKRSGKVWNFNLEF